MSNVIKQEVMVGKLDPTKIYLKLSNNVYRFNPVLSAQEALTKVESIVSSQFVDLPTSEWTKIPPRPQYHQATLWMRSDEVAPRFKFLDKFIAKCNESTIDDLSRMHAAKEIKMAKLTEDLYRHEHQGDATCDSWFKQHDEIQRVLDVVTQECAYALKCINRLDARSA
tara:strand:+ start:204 stop:707 length:504 start_codon:yes stop_codon:yes gene_type:complete